MKNARATAVLFVLLSSACSAEIGARFTDRALRSGPDTDPDFDDAVEEQCGNELDDDGDGEVDENCGCELGQVRACYPGPASTRGVGICQDGVQRCDDHFEFPSWGACEGAVSPKAELLNGLDDDCDGLVDCIDGDDCPDADPCELNPADPACAVGGGEGLCPDGQTATFRSNLPQGQGGSSITDGDGGPPMDMTCEQGGACAAGQVAVIDPRTGAATCVDPPPDCPEGTSPDYRTSGYGAEGFEGRGGDGPDGAGQLGPDGWVCSPPCDIVVQYGGIYGGRVVCTEPPNFGCPVGETPTFVFETEQWECRPTCDNGLYDQIFFEGGVLCVPC